MANAIHDVVLKYTKSIIQQYGFFSLSIKEATPLNNQPWINVYFDHEILETNLSECYYHNLSFELATKDKA